VRGNALFGKRPTEKDPAKGTSPAVDFTRREAARKRPVYQDLAGQPTLPCRPDDVLVLGAGCRGTLGRLAFSKVSRYCLAHAQCPVMAVPPPVLARELRHGRLARAFWRRSLTPEQVLRDQGRPAA
jgi:Universal stress protein family